MTGAQRLARLSRLVGLFGEIEALARRARQAADGTAKAPFLTKVHTSQYDIELVTMLAVMDRIRETLRELESN